MLHRWQSWTATYTGTHLKVENARLYDRPSVKPPVVIAAGGPKAGRFAG